MHYVCLCLYDCKITHMPALHIMYVIYYFTKCYVSKYVVDTQFYCRQFVELIGQFVAVCPLSHSISVALVNVLSSPVYSITFRTEYICAHCFLA